MRVIVYFVCFLLVSLSIQLSALTSFSPSSFLDRKQRLCCCDINGCQCCNDDATRCLVKVAETNGSRNYHQLKAQFCFNNSSAVEYALLFHPYLNMDEKKELDIQIFFDSLTPLFFSTRFVSVLPEEKPPQHYFI